MTKVDKEEIYVKLAKEYGWTFNQIAEMTLRQQYVALRGSKYRTFDTVEELQAWQRQIK